MEYISENPALLEEHNRAVEAECLNANAKFVELNKNHSTGVAKILEKLEASYQAIDSKYANRVRQLLQHKLPDAEVQVGFDAVPTFYLGLGGPDGRSLWRSFPNRDDDGDLMDVGEQLLRQLTHDVKEVAQEHANAFRILSEATEQAFDLEADREYIPSALASYIAQIMGVSESLCK